MAFEFDAVGRHFRRVDAAAEKGVLAADLVEVEIGGHDAQGVWGGYCPGMQSPAKLLLIFHFGRGLMVLG